MNNLQHQQTGGYDQTTRFQKQFLVSVASLASLGMLCWSAYVLCTKWQTDKHLLITVLLLVMSAGLTVYMFFTGLEDAKGHIQDHVIIAMVCLGVIAMWLPNSLPTNSWYQILGFRLTILLVPLTSALVLCGKMFIRGAMANAELVNQLQDQITELEDAREQGEEDFAGQPDAPPIITEYGQRPPPPQNRKTTVH